MRDMPQIGIATVDGFLGMRHRHIVLARVSQGILTGANIPFAPRRDHLQRRVQRLVG